MINLPEPQTDFEILFHEKQVLVASKPGGLLTQGPPGIDSFETRIKDWLVSMRTTDRKTYLGVPHRLDRPASGIMVFGLDKPTTRQLANQFQQRTVAKTYQCLVEGQVQPQSGEWVDYMRKCPDAAQSEIVEEATEGAQIAKLKYEVLQGAGNFSHLQIQLETGRTHQIRLQAATRGFPILGDTLYGSKTEFGPQTTDLRERWISLHARTIAFDHPNQQRRIEFASPLPEHWMSVAGIEL